jgi:hypothetical protein
MSNAATATATVPVAAGAEPAPDWPLDRPLPVEVAGSGQGWLTRYRRWPVFGPGWVRGRLLSVALPILVLYALLMLLSGPPDADGPPYGSIATLGFHLALPLIAGPWLAGRVRAQGWPARREARALWAVMALVILAQFAFHYGASEAVKQAIAEATGQVDADGRRKRAALIIGVTIGRPDGSTPPMTRDPEARPDPMARAINLAGAALLSFVLAGGAGLGALRRERAGLTALAQQRALARAEAQRREAELRLSVLAAQVEPHFLFNTLAGVRSAIATDPGRASGMIDALVAYLRAAIPRLRSDGGADATLASQVEIVRAYLSLMRTRLPRLAFAIEMPQALAELPFPPLMLISLAENAVKHGVEPKMGAAEIRLTAKRTDDGRLAVTVADDGVGFDGASDSAGAGGAGSTGSGLGLVNLRERLEALYGVRASLELRTRPGGGVAATITLPVDEPAAHAAPEAPA